MAVKTFPWPDGSGQKVTVTYSGTGNDTVNVASEENSTPYKRSMTLIFETNDKTVSKELKVEQLEGEFVFRVTQTVFEFPIEGGTKKFTLISNVKDDWTTDYADIDHAHLDRDEGVGPCNIELTVKAQRNDTTADINTTITISHPNTPEVDPIVLQVKIAGPKMVDFDPKDFSANDFA